MRHNKNIVLGTPLRIIHCDIFRIVTMLQSFDMQEVPEALETSRRLGVLPRCRDA